jgi:hypothetical protein
LRIFRHHRHTVGAHDQILSALVSLLSFRVRSRASLELELIALRHQVIVLRRQRHRRLRLFLTDRLFWVWLYQVRPHSDRDQMASQGLSHPLVMAITPFWTTQDEWRNPHLIRRMSSADPFWGGGNRRSDPPL